MTYPLSTPVTDGMPTGYQQYNNLRLDALTLGAPVADAVALGTGLVNFADNLVLEPLSTTRVRVPYRGEAVTLMIAGQLCQATANTDLAPGSISGGAALWYIFANRVAGYTTFSLSANTSAIPSATQRLIGQVLWTGAACDFNTLWCYSGGKPGIAWAQASRAAAQSIPNATWTAVSFDTEVADPDPVGMIALGTFAERITIQRPGLYLVTAALSFAHSATGAARAALLTLGAATALVSATTTNGIAAVPPRINLAYVGKFAYGDYIWLQVYQDCTVGLNITAPITLTAAALSA